MNKADFLRKPTPSTSLLPLTAAVMMASTLSSAPALGQGDALVLEEVVVTARKRDESLQEVPVSVTSISAELQNPTIRNLTDLEGYAPNLTIAAGTAGPGAANISIRGVSYQEVDKSLDPSIGVILDGIYLGTNVGQALENFDIARVEVLRGPQGTLFGKNTIGGVLNVVRNKPTGDFSGELRAGTGSWDLKDFKGVVHFPIIEDGLAAKVYATDSSHDGWLENTTIDEDTARLDTTNYGFALLATPTDNFEALFSYDRLENDSDIGGSHNRNSPDTLSCGAFVAAGLWPKEVGCEEFDTGSDEDSVSTNDHQNAFVETDAYTLRMEWDVGPGIITSITGYRENDEFRRAEFDGSAAPYITLTFDQDYEQTSQELNFTSTFSDNFDFVAGLYYWDSEYSQTSRTIGLITTVIFGFPPGTEGTLNQNQETESIAGYFQGDWHINDQWTATLGMRYTREEKDFAAETASYFLADGTQIVDGTFGTESEEWSETTPKLGIRYQYNDDTMFFASYAQGFKSGGFFGRNTTVAGFTTPYDPEYVDTYELGVKSDLLDGRVRFNATLFFSEYTDKQEENFVLLDDGTVGTLVLNAGEVDMPGVELELTALLTEHFRLRATYGYLDAEYTEYDADLNNDGIVTDNTDLDLRRAPENTFGASAIYSRAIGNGEFTADLTYSWKDDYETINTNNPVGSVDGFGIWNGSLDYIYDNSWQISVYGRNLADERTLVATTPISILSSFGTYNQPRSWGVEVRYTFGGLAGD